MKLEIIKKGKTILFAGEDAKFEDFEKKLEEIANNNTVKSVELILIENSTISDYNKLITEQDTKCLDLQKIYLND